MPSNRSNPPPASVSPSLHLAAFYTDMPELWFQQAEAQFRLKGVVADDAKFDHLVATLPQDVARQVIRVLRAPPHTGKYLALKTELLSVFGASRAARADALLSLSGLGDRKPSQLASEMLALLGDEPHHILVTRLFVRQLPADIRLQLRTRLAISGVWLPVPTSCGRRNNRQFPRFHRFPPLRTRAIPLRPGDLRLHIAGGRRFGWSRRLLGTPQRTRSVTTIDVLGPRPGTAGRRASFRETGLPAATRDWCVGWCCLQPSVRSRFCFGQGVSR